MNVKSVVKPFAKFVLKERYHNLDRLSHPSFSQMGEDMILRKIFGNQKNGFYVDIGAFHPKLSSNTYYFYINGWRGINIDAMPGSMDEFKKIRPKDINIESAILNEKQTKTFYIFDEKTLNTLSLKTVKEHETKFPYRVKRSIRVKTRKLSEILDKYMPKNKKIDLLNIDTEGTDYSVLLSNNWKKYVPRLVVVEDLNFNLDNFTTSKIYQLMKKLGYTLIAKTNVSLIFKHNNF